MSAACQQGKEALRDAWIGNMLMDPSKGKQEVITPNNKVHCHAMQCVSTSYTTTYMAW